MDNRNNGNGHTLPEPITARPDRVKQTIQAAKLQRFAFDAAQALQRALTKDGVLTVTREDAQALAMLVKSWDTARDALRVLRGRGLPASVKSARTRSPGPVQPIEPA